MSDDDIPASLAEAMRELQRHAEVINCGDLARAVGYPVPYTEAQKMLAAEGWYYDIATDAWYRGRAGFV